MTKALYIAVMVGIALGGLFALAQPNLAAAAFAGMAFFAWTHAYNLRFPDSNTLSNIIMDFAGPDAQVKVFRKGTEINKKE